MSKPWIVCGFFCECGNEWITHFYRRPAWDDYRRKCDHCGRMCWPESKHDFRR